MTGVGPVSGVMTGAAGAMGGASATSGVASAANGPTTSISQGGTNADPVAQSAAASNPTTGLENTNSLTEQSSNPANNELQQLMQQLNDLVESLSAAQVLIALMLAQGGSDDEKNGGSLGLALMAGAALGGMLQQQMQQLTSPSGYGGGISPVGGNLDVMV